jgi:20S proteasome alpha/beta subunit
MTIAVGLLAENCVVIAADTQETYDTAKVSGDKIQSLISFQQDSKGVIAITGAGDADYLDKFAQDAMHAYLHHSGPLVRALEQTLAAFYKAHVLPLGMQWAASGQYAISTIVAYQRGGETKLLASGHLAMKDAGRYVARGSGETIARAVLRSLYREGMSREAAMRLAAYAVYRAKDVDPHSGKDTDVILLSGGTHRQIPERTVRQWEDVFDRLGRINDLTARQILGVQRSSSPIDQNELDRIEASFVHSSHQWTDHPMPLPRPQGDPVVQPSRSSPTRGRKSRPPSRG